MEQRAYSVSVTSLCEHVEEDRLRRRLKYFFMNPCQKFRAKRKFPWKLMIQFIKALVVTIQLIMFGNFRSAHVNFLEKTNIAFKHLYLANWNPSYETMPYPPSTGAFAAYTHDDFYNMLNFSLAQYNQTEAIAIGTFHFTSDDNVMVPMTLCLRYYREGTIWAFNETYIFDPTIIEDCFPMLPVDGVYDSEKYLKQINKSINFDGLLEATLKFSLKTVHLKSLSQLNLPDCFQFDVEINFDNKDHNGQMAVKLTSEVTVLRCAGHIIHGGSDTAAVMTTVFDVFVMLICLVSLMLCIRSLYRAFLLQRAAAKYFETSSNNEPLTFSDKMDFVNLWYVMILFNDLMSSSGCFVKVAIENKKSTNYELCGVLLGSGNLLVWCGLLRYLGFFHKYNILLKTIKRSAPNVARFLLCTVVFYIGFVICGWVVLGPYHLKFRDISTSAECLFSLLNGDDVFTTFAAMTGDTNTVMWWYSRIYLYVFISLFCYVVLSIFISVIMDTYETIKKELAEGKPDKSRLQLFAEECQDEPHNLFAERNTGCLFPSCCPIRSRGPLSVQAEGEEYTALVS